jgi:hypothetical protein
VDSLALAAAVLADESEDELSDVAAAVSSEVTRAVSPYVEVSEVSAAVEEEPMVRSMGESDDPGRLGVASTTSGMRAAGLAALALVSAGRETNAVTVVPVCTMETTVQPRAECSVRRSANDALSYVDTLIEENSNMH